jgi:uncharacterized radical SAM protein YgiQ
MSKNSFLPMFPDEMKARGYDELDVLIISGDAYVDHPSYGTAVIGRILEDQGYKVGIIAQPDWRHADDFKRLGRPRLCVCITSGNVDSMVAHYTANKRKRHDDDYTPAGVEGKRPDRALIVYSNRIREVFKGIPIVLGGIEASMRRLAHYDYWEDAPRRSVLLDAKANIIVYGMGEREIVRRLDQGETIGAISDVAGTVVNVKKEDIPKDVLLIPSFEEVQKSHKAFNQAFAVIYQQMSPATAKAIVQPHKDQYVLQNPPALPLTTKELDHSYDLPYKRSWHPSYDALGGVKGFETVRWSIIALRGCPGECSFCGLGMHQGRIVQSRSEESILKEARLLASQNDFRGTITDIGGPTANLYLAQCAKWQAHDPCASKQCLMPQKCSSLRLAYDKTLALYRAIKKIPGVKHLFVESGIRYDLLIEPQAQEYLKELCTHYISGQMKVAPEHTDEGVLRLMNKPTYKIYEAFVKNFEKVNARLEKRKYLVNYFISAHPGSRLNEALACSTRLLARHIHPEQIQDYLPLPMTLSSCLYYTGVHPLSGETVFVAKEPQERLMQRALLQSQNPDNRPLIKKALSLLGREDLLNYFLPQQEKPQGNKAKYSRRFLRQKRR